MDPTSMVVAFGTTVRKQRRKRDLTLEELGLRARLSRRQLGEIERGNGNPRLRTILLLIEALEIDFDEFAAFWAEARREVEGGSR